MDSLFGLSMTTLMLILLGIFGVAMLSVLLIFFRARTMFKMGLRNIPRRGAQTSLVIIGLMLATLITTAAFTTGDTVNYSIERTGYELLQRTDLSLNLLGENTNTGTATPVYFSDGVTGALDQRYANDPDIEGFIPMLIEPIPAVNTRTSQSEPTFSISGIDPQHLNDLGGLRLTSGGKADLSKLGANDIYISKMGAEKLDADVGDKISLHAGGSKLDVTVIGIVEDELASSGNQAFDTSGSGGGSMLLSSVQRLTGHPGEINVLNVALKGTVETSYTRSDSAISRLEPFLQSPEGRALLNTPNPVSVEAVKKDSVESAEEFGNVFTSFFLLLGLFSIAAGIMLIFLIFVMLAAERQAEMGIARAVGAQRSSLMQSFVAEGLAYSVMAGAVGALFGVIAALGLVVGFLKIAGGFDFIHAHVTVRSLVISYCLGVVLTFLTVVFSSLKVSSVNIVSAIRGTEDDGRTSERRKTSWKWVIIGIPFLILVPVGVWMILRKGFGLAWTWIIAPLLILLGLWTILLASDNSSQFLFSFGVSVLPLALAMIASRFRAPARLTWTLVGAYLALYWLAPVDYGKIILGKELSGDIEMFVLSGVMVVIAFTLIIVYNARLLTLLVERGSLPRYTATLGLLALTIASFVGAVLVGDAGDGTGELLYLFGAVLGIATAFAFAAVQFPTMAPALKMGIAYPLSNRFRTGMAIAMFSLIIFSLSTFGAINNSFVSLLTADGGDGGWDVLATASRNTADPNLDTSLRQVNAPVRNDIDTIGRTTIFTGESQVRQPGDEYTAFPVIAADSTFFAMPDSRLSSYANGYDSERAVFDAVSRDPKLAIVDPSVLPNGFNIYEFNVSDVTVKDDRLDAFDLEYTNIVTGQSATVKVIGVLAIQLDSTITAGVYVNEAAYTQTFGAPEYLRSYVKLNDGVKATNAARDIEAALVEQGIQADSTRKLLDDSVAQNNSFIRMFQGFMALGLLTGIAALGVIAFRSVVERRQQIGMLRAIGYQKDSVAMTFVLESGFIAIMGILSGVVGGMIIARNLFTSGEFGEGIQFAIPWTEVIVVSVTAFVFSMLMTWWPSRQAASVPVADALRYE